MGVVFTRLTNGNIKIQVDSNKPRYITDPRAVIIPSDDNLSLSITDNRGNVLKYNAADVTTINGAAAPVGADNICDTLSSGVFFLDSSQGKQVVVSNAQVNNTGNITENTVYTATIPAGSIGANGSLDILFGISMTNNANAKNFRIKLNGNMITYVQLASTISAKYLSTIHNRGALNSNFTIGGPTSTPNIGFGSVASVNATYAIDFSLDVTLTVTIQNAVATDTASLEFIRVVAYK